MLVCNIFVINLFHFRQFAGKMNYLWMYGMMGCVEKFWESCPQAWQQVDVISLTIVAVQGNLWTSVFMQILIYSKSIVVVLLMFRKCIVRLFKSDANARWFHPFGSSIVYSYENVNIDDDYHYNFSIINPFGYVFCSIYLKAFSLAPFSSRCEISCFKRSLFPPKCDALSLWLTKYKTSKVPRKS